MLVLNLIANRRVRLALPDGREIWLTHIGQHSNGGIKLGIEAPNDIQIAREEIITRPVEAEEEAPGTAP